MMQNLSITLANGSNTEIVYVWYNRHGEQNVSYTAPRKSERVEDNYYRVSVTGPRAAQSIELLHQTYFAAALKAAGLSKQY